MSIVKRTVYYDNTDGYVRFWDWAIVTTSKLGSMAEPFQPDETYSFTKQREFDPTDEMSLITDMRAYPIDKHMLALSGGDNQLIGGTLCPRVGR